MLHHRGKVAASLALAVLLALPAWAAGDGKLAEPGSPVAGPPADATVAERVMPEIPAPVPGQEAPPDPGEVPAEASPAETQAPAATVTDEPAPTVEYDVAKLPLPVKRIREQIIAAAATGDIEQLRPAIEANGEPPQFSFNDVEDPIAFLKSLSGDADGREILAILIEVLDAGYVHADIGTPDEMYVWPYFARYPVDKLTPQQLVELFKLIYAGDYEDMKAEGHYLFYRVGIAPTGEWKYFMAGE